MNSRGCLQPDGFVDLRKYVNKKQHQVIGVVKAVLGKLVLLTATFLVQSCNTEVPDAVQQSFAKIFHVTHDIHWWQSSPKEWAVSFYIKKFYYETARFTSDGILESIQYPVDIEDVPIAISNGLHSKYPMGTITDVYELDKSSKSYFIVRLMNNNKLIEVCCENGKMNSKILTSLRHTTDNILIEND